MTRLTAAGRSGAVGTAGGSAGGSAGGLAGVDFSLDGAASASAVSGCLGSTDVDLRTQTADKNLPKNYFLGYWATN